MYASIQILLLAFSKEAAYSLRTHASALLGSLSSHPLDKIDSVADGEIYSGTFHVFALGILRAHGGGMYGAREPNPMSKTQQLNLLRRIVKDECEWHQPLTQRDFTSILQHISMWKSSGAAPGDLDPSECVSSLEALACRAYHHYESHLATTGMMDFDDIILRATSLLHTRPDLLQHYRSQFRYILVDEFQDVNKAQYTFLRTLALGNDFDDGEAGISVMCAGDDDQSIYGFRGARASEIFGRFVKDFPGTEVLSLQVSYRLPGHILLAAQEMIQKNGPKMPLQTPPMTLLPREPELQGLLLQENGFTIVKQRLMDMVLSRIVVQEAWDSKEEAEFVAKKIEELMGYGSIRKLGEVAVLVRSAWQISELERAFVVRKIPYRFYGSSQKETSLLAKVGSRRSFCFLRLLRVPTDDVAFEVVYRDALSGATDVDGALHVMKAVAAQEGKSIMEVAKEGLAQGLLSPRLAYPLDGFVHAITYWSDKLSKSYIKGASGVELLKEILGEAGCLGGPDDKAIEELCTMMGMDYDYEGMESFFSKVAEAADLGEGAWTDDPGDQVVLSTMHGIKGQEFDLVFLTGWEEGIFPLGLRSQQPLGLKDEEWQAHLKEERRLGYVALTRARTNAYISFAHRRKIHGKWAPCSPSRFLRELPVELIKLIEMGSKSRFKATHDMDFRRFLPQGNTRYDDLVLGSVTIPSRIPFSPDKKDASSLLPPPSPTHGTQEIITLSREVEEGEEALGTTSDMTPADKSQSSGADSVDKNSSAHGVQLTGKARNGRNGTKKTAKTATSQSSANAVVATESFESSSSSSSSSGNKGFKGLMGLLDTMKTPAPRNSLRAFYLEGLKFFGFKRCRIWVMVSPDGEMEERQLSKCKSPHLGLFFLTQVLRTPRPAGVKYNDIKALLKGLLSKYGVGRGRVEVPAEDISNGSGSKRGSDSGGSSSKNSGSNIKSKPLSACSLAQLGSLLWNILVGELR